MSERGVGTGAGSYLLFPKKSVKVFLVLSLLKIEEEEGPAATASPHRPQAACRDEPQDRLTDDELARGGCGLEADAERSRGRSLLQPSRSSC